MKTPKTIGFIGGGKMATALATGFLQTGWTTPTKLWASDISEVARQHFAKKTGGSAVAENLTVLERAEIIILAVKPQQIVVLFPELRPYLESRHLVISIAAGVTLETLSGGLGNSQRLIRVMPNTPALIQAGASGFARGGSATTDDATLIRELFSSVGLVVELPEHLIDCVTGLSGSGPAFGYMMIEALADGGVKTGLPRDIAVKLAAQTLLGAARMVLETGTHPGELKDAVCSPGGTTIAGVHALELGGLRGCLMNAVEVATHRARELGRAKIG